jgi:hypothetical protein
MKKNLWLMLPIVCLAVGFYACGVKESPSVVCGSDWIKSRAAVVDTGSTFAISDPLIIQFRYGKEFDFPELDWSIYEGTLAQKGRELRTRKSKVSPKEGSYTIQGVSLKGGFMRAREMLNATEPGTYVVEFRCGNKILASKELRLILNSEKNK